MGNLAVWNGERRGVGWPTSRVHVPRAEGDEPLPYVMELENDAPSVPSGKPFADSPTPKHRRNPRGVYAFLAR